jgi:hypothetical protein
LADFFLSGLNALARSRIHEDNNTVSGGLLPGCPDYAWGKRVGPSDHDFRPTGLRWSAARRRIKGNQLGWRGSFGPRPLENMKKAFYFSNPF